MHDKKNAFSTKGVFIFCKKSGILYGIMTVYIEYAFFQNLLLDGVLLWLSYQAIKMPVPWRRLCLSAFLGAAFAVLYPLLRLPAVLGLTLKISAGALLCLLANGKQKRKQSILFTASFFSLSFLFGGALEMFALGEFPYDKAVTPIGFACLACLSLRLFRRLYKKATILRRVYDCVIAYEEKSIAVKGFVDSGNMATKKGAPVCFVSPEIVYELWGEACLLLDKERGHVCDEICITTVAGRKNTPIYRGSLLIKDGTKMRKIKEVYFAPSVHMISREYEVILHSSMFEEGEEI